MKSLTKKTTTFDNYLFRCSELGKIMSGFKEKNLTELQEKELKTLEEKLAVGKITDKQIEKMNALTIKRDKPIELSKGVKTHLENIHKSTVFKRSKRLTTKYLEKGIYVEEFSFSLLSNVDDTFYIKNKDRLKNEFIQGEPDNTQEKVRDIKSSWDWSTFPLHEEEIPNSDYDWQLRGYMALTGLEEAELIYCLVDTPEHIIQKEINSFCWKSGVEELSEELEKEIRSNLTFNDIPEKLRIKKFFIKRDLEKERQIYKQVSLCRKYLNELNERIKF